MSKVKKVLAIILSMAMILGMSLTTFAAPSAITIPISGAGSGATFKWLQVIAPDSEEATGWAFTSNDIAEDFTRALGASDAQTAIWMLIGNATPSATLPQGVSAATASQIAAAMANVKAGNYSLNVTGEGEDAGKTVVVSNAGVYYIEGTETGYTYNPMAAYVSFGYKNGVPSELECAGVTAKRVPQGVTKEASADKDVTEVNRTETYTVTPSIVPHIPDNELEGAEYILKDTISGAEYVRESDGTVKLTVYIEGVADPMYFPGTVTITDADKNKYSFEADLSSLLVNNQYANKGITISYQATVKDIYVRNDVFVGDGTNDSKYGTNHEELYTATINLMKYAADSNNDIVNDNQPLANAEFKVYKLVSGVKNYAVATAGVLTGWTTIESSGTTFTTNASGQISLAGLDAGDYYFTETKAPEGYSKNTEDKMISIARPSEDATQILTNSVNFFNDTLSSLPSTGGIGTTIFTIGGCVIMIAAAGLYFASRRRQENK